MSNAPKYYGKQTNQKDRRVNPKPVHRFFPKTPETRPNNGDKNRSNKKDKTDDKKTVGTECTSTNQGSVETGIHNSPGEERKNGGRNRE